MSHPFFRVNTMGSDNPSSADNQQERLLTNDWLVGFVDGEGCFSSPIYRQASMRLGWQVQPALAVVQGASSKNVLDRMVPFFGCGKVSQPQTRQPPRGSVPLLRLSIRGPAGQDRSVLQGEPTANVEARQLRQVCRHHRPHRSPRTSEPLGLTEIAEISET